MSDFSVSVSQDTPKKLRFIWSNIVSQFGLIFGSLLTSSSANAAVDLSGVQTNLTSAFTAVLAAFTAVFGEYTILIVSIGACFLLVRAFM